MRRLLMYTLALAAINLVVVATATANHVACGDTLTVDTTLDGDLVACPARGLVIGADGVDLDLAGHTISGAPMSFFGIEARNVSGVTVHNGTVSGFDSFGVLFSRVSGSAVQNLDVAAHFNGIYLSGDSDRNRIEGNTVTALNGIRLVEDPDENVVARNSITADIDGIALRSSASRLTHNVIERNRIAGGSESLIAEAIDDGVFAGNVIDGGFRGMTVGGGRGIAIQKNTVSGAGQGITIFGANDSIAEKNVVTGSRFQGVIMYESRGTTLRHNTSSGNGTEGISLVEFSRPFGPSTLVHNVANDNGTLGISGDSNTIDGGHNRASGNGDPRQCVNVACK